MEIRILFLFLALTSAQNTPSEYFKACLVNKDINSEDLRAPTHPLRQNSVRDTVKKRPCRSYQCLKQNELLDLDKLKSVRCQSDFQCSNDISGMICSNHSIATEQKYCSCPYGYAYSTLECRCKPAELCWNDKVILFNSQYI